PDENTPPPPAPVAFRLPAPAGAHPEADAVLLPTRVPQCGPQLPAPRLAGTAPLRSALCSHTLRPAGPDNTAVVARSLWTGGPPAPGASAPFLLPLVPGQRAPNPA